MNYCMKGCDPVSIPVSKIDDGWNRELGRWTDGRTVGNLPCIIIDLTLNDFEEAGCDG